ncbi:MAG: protease inhibitor I42 family protein [Betaproteobacteria bacterium]
MRSTVKCMLTRGALVALAMLMAACAMTPPGPPAVEMGELDNAADGTVIAIKRGGELKVLLDANAISGYQWQVQRIAGPVLPPMGNPIFLSKGDPRDVRAGGFMVFRFRAEQAGTATLQFDYKHVSEANVAPVKTVRYSVSVAP